MRWRGRLSKKEHQRLGSGQIERPQGFGCLETANGGASGRSFLRLKRIQPHLSGKTGAPTLLPIGNSATREGGFQKGVDKPFEKCLPVRTFQHFERD